MISTKGIISDIKDVPEEWVYEYYLNLKEKLTGQDIKMLSAFNSKDKVPSMFVYFDTTSSTYKFKDFSSGNQGNCWNLVQHLYNLSFGEAAAKIINDYQVYIKNNTVSEKRELVIHDKFKVVDYEMRHWNTLDQKYWMMFKIGSGLLDRYNVVPLEFFTMEKEEIDSTMTSFTFKRPYMYGYFRNDGSLYKIYMPKNTDKKFIKVENYIQGTEQLKYDCKYLIITSSLKDLMCFNKLGINNVEAIAPDSENTMIGEKAIEEFQQYYQKIIVLFDNDEPGIKAAERYKTKYGLNYIILPMEKDLSDSVKMHGIDKVREVLFPLLKQTL
jgi:5S rRNA maturation endonuclease (ribonuclease M5)